MKNRPHSGDTQPKQQLQGWEPSYLLGYAALPQARWDLNVLLDSCEMRVLAALLSKSLPPFFSNYISPSDDLT